MSALRFMLGGLGRSVLAAAVALSTGLVVAVPGASAVSNDVVISQVYGGGGNAGATLTHDFIELFNRGSAPIDLTNWSVQYASSTGASWQATPLSGTLQPGQYYLVQQALGDGGTQPLPPPDATGSISMGGTSGKVAVVTSSTLLTCGGPTRCLPNPAIRDLVGYGAGTTDFEGTGATAAPSNTTGVGRAQAGCTDADNNAADFVVAPPAPRNKAAAVRLCGDPAPVVTSVTPTNGAVDAALDASLTIVFSEPVGLAADWFSLVCLVSGPHAATTTGGPTTFTLNPTQDFVLGESCTLRVLAARVSDQDADDPPNTMQSDFESTFWAGGQPARIRDIQGTEHLSALNEQRVADVPGVVTGLRNNGFYFQDPHADRDASTSEGIFVFTRTDPRSTISVGDALLVDGTVSEFRPGGMGGTNNLTITQLTAPVITLDSKGNALPPPVVIGRGGRNGPNTAIEDDAFGSVEDSGVFDPAEDGIDFYETLEHMLVRINQPIVTGATNDFGEIWVLPDNGAGAAVRTNRGGIVIREHDFNPERILVDDEVFKLNPGNSMPLVNVGARLAGPVDGILDFDFSNFRVQAKAPPTVISNPLTRESTTPAGLNQLAVGTFNVENLDAAEPPDKFATLADLIVNNMRAPDLVTLEEVQDNNGGTNDGTVDASRTLARLIDAIQAAGGPTYDFRQINPVNNQDGGEPGGNIRVVFLFRTDRGLSFVDRPGGGSTTPVSVVAGPDGPRLSASPGRIAPTDAAFNASRKPLAAEFEYNGHRLFVVGNHFNSKGGDQPLFGRFQPPNRVTEAQRHRQAAIVHDFVASILELDDEANVIVLGDINDFEFSETMSILTAGEALTPLMSRLPQRERYSYVFEGNSQSLDHILVSQHLLRAARAQFDVVHVNAEFHDQASDHDPQVARFTLRPARK